MAIRRSTTSTSSNQLREVLTNYPGIEEVWFDGAAPKVPTASGRNMTGAAVLAIDS